MKHTLTCEVVRDLLPLYIDHLTSEQTAQEVKAHLETCEACRAQYRDMSGAEPASEEPQSEIDYLKKVNRSRRRVAIIAISAVLATLLIGGTIALMLGTTARRLSVQNDTLVVENEQLAEENEQLAEENTQLIEEAALPTVTYDPETKALVITGTDRYDEIVIPDEAENAISLNVQDDQFHMTMDLTVRYNEDESLKDFIPGFVDRTEKSLQFFRAWFRENAKDYYDPAVSEKMIEFNITEDVGFLSRIDRDRIKINISRLYWNRDTALVYAMMNCRYCEWEQMGYLQNLAYAVNPYNEWLLVMDDSADAYAAVPYYQAAVKAGLDPKHMTPEGYMIMTDTIALYSIKEDWINHPVTSTFEYLPVMRIAFFTVSPETVTNRANEELTAFMAGSFIHRLSDVYGLDAVNAFVFGEKTFDEAFGVDYETARDAWIAWLYETYPID